MLWRDDGLNDGGEVVNIGERFDTEDDVVERCSRSAGGFFGRANDCEVELVSEMSQRAARDGLIAYHVSV